MTTKKLSYQSSGVNYDNLDKIKRLAQTNALKTSGNLHPVGFESIDQSRGETAFVWDEGDSYRAIVIESLGTKSTIAEEVYLESKKSYFSEIAQDTVAMIVNDLIAVGARPLVVNAYFGLGNSDWLLEGTKGEDLINGFAKACDLSDAVWGGGETPSLTGIIQPNAVDLAGAAVGIINPKSRLTLGDKIKPGDAIILIESNGIHANGISLVRKIADTLRDRYLTSLPSGDSLGSNILRPTYLYPKVINSLFEASIDIHYMANITGHGFRKIMRANEKFSYIIETLPDLAPETAGLFRFIQEKSGLSTEDMYGTFNMGAGFAIILPEPQAQRAQKIIEENGFKSWISGKVEEGEKQVVIKPLNITFKSESLNIR